MKRIVIVAAVFLCAAVAVPFATGHATISPLQPQGKALTSASVSYVLRVPNERAAQSTFRVVMRVPAAVQRVITVKQMPDWTITLRRRDTGERNARGEKIFAVQQITWRAKKGNAIRPGFYGEFLFRMQNPATPQRLCFSADQWYSARRKGGRPELVRWSGAATSPTPALCLEIVSS